MSPSHPYWADRYTLDILTDREYLNGGALCFHIYIKDSFPLRRQIKDKRFDSLLQHRVNSVLKNKKIKNKICCAEAQLGGGGSVIHASPFLKFAVDAKTSKN